MPTTLTFRWQTGQVASFPVDTDPPPAIAETRDALANYRHEVPRLFLGEVEYELQMTEAEAKWTRSLLDELSAGTFPDLAAWQAWHESGEMPPGLAELAERGVAQD